LSGLWVVLLVQEGEEWTPWVRLAFALACIAGLVLVLTAKTRYVVDLDAGTFGYGRLWTRREPLGHVVAVQITCRPRRIDRDAAVNAAVTCADGAAAIATSAPANCDDDTTRSRLLDWWFGIGSFLAEFVAAFWVGLEVDAYNAVNEKLVDYQINVVLDEARAHLLNLAHTTELSKARKAAQQVASLLNLPLADHIPARWTSQVLPQTKPEAGEGGKRAQAFQQACPAGGALSRRQDADAAAETRGNLGQPQ
jgi:hypothetical protein